MLCRKAGLVGRAERLDDLGGKLGQRRPDLRAGRWHTALVQIPGPGP